MAKLRAQTLLPLADAEALSLVRTCADLCALKLEGRRHHDAPGGALSAAEQTLLDRAAALPPTSSSRLRDVRRAIRAGGDPLGQLFCQIRPAAERRAMGAYYTQPAIAEPMLSWIAASDPARVVDAGCGSGRFAAGALEQMSRARVVAVDLDPLATMMTRATLSVVAGRRKNRFEVVHGDYTELELEPIDGITAFIGNPPYVRHHDLPARMKSWARDVAAERGVHASGLAGLHAYFYLRTATLARPGDVGSFVTSAEWIDVGYGRMIRELFAGELGGVSLQVLAPDAIAFDDAMTTAAIACFEVGGDHRSARMRSVSSAADLDDLDKGRRIRRSRLVESERWSPLLRSPRRSSGKTEIALGEVARVHRGVVTGSNRFFVMSPQQAAALGLEAHCRPVISSARQILGAGGSVRAAEAPKVILDVDDGFDVDSDPALAAYLRRGEELGVHQGYVTSRRRPWWRLGIGTPPPIVASYMARQPPVFALNPDRMVLLNIAHGLYPRDEQDEASLRRLVAALNDSRESYRGSGRTYHGGLEKFEPGEMEALPIPAALAPRAV